MKPDSLTLEGPLSGLRVLDTSTMYAAPMIATLLADHGAEVVKIEPPEGDSYRDFPGRMWTLVARNKRSLVLDLRNERDQDALHGMIADFDVIVVNLPPAQLRKRRLDYATLSGLNPRLIMAHFSGYGLSGPYAERAGNGTVGEAFAGFTHMTGEADGPPVMPSLPLGDGISGYAGAFAVLAACYDRLKNDAPGRLIDINPVEVMLQITGPVLAAYSGEGEPPGRLGNRLANPALRNVFRAADGRWIAFALSTPRQLVNVADLVGHAARGPDGQPEGDLEASVRSWVAAHDRDKALATLLDLRLMVTPVNDARDLLEDPHVRERRSLCMVQTREFGPVINPMPAPRFAGVPLPAEMRTPELNEYAATLADRSGSRSGAGSTNKRKE